MRIIWGLLAVVAAVAGVLALLELLPVGVVDLLQRALPVVLVLLGLSVFLRNRVPAAGVISLVISVALVAGVSAFAYSTRAAQTRDDYRVVIDQPVSESVGLLQITLDTLTTQVEIGLSPVARTVGGSFEGSSQSVLEVHYEEDANGLALLTLQETKPEAFPALEAVGRGTLKIELPADVALDVLVKSASGNATLNLGGTALERLNIELAEGNALVTMPSYEPRSGNLDDNRGTFTIRNGDLTLFVPEDVAGRFEIDRDRLGDPQFDSGVYNFIAGALLENRNFATAEIVIRYTVIAPRGQIRVETTP